MGLLDWLKRKRRGGPEDFAAWIAAQIEEHGPERGDESAVTRLAMACAALGGQGTRIFGMAMPATLPDRDRLRDEALTVLRRWIPKLGKPATDQLAGLALSWNLPITLQPRRDELAAERRERFVQKVADSCPSDPRNEALERAVLDDPDDRDACLVLGDWLQMQGDPRGELIALELRGESDPAAHKAAQKHFDRHYQRLLGPFIPYQKVRDATGDDAFTWRRGYIHSARLSFYGEAGDLAELVGLLLCHPSGRFLAELVLGFDDQLRGGGDYADVVEVIRDASAPALRKLHFGDFVYPDQSELSWFQVGDLTTLWPAVPRLAHLIVQGACIELGELTLPALELLEIRTCDLSRTCARSIARIHAPKLRHLDVWYGSQEYGDTTIDDLELLLSRTDLGLVHLGIRNAELTDEVCERLHASPLLANLETLDLSMGTMSDAGARALAAHADSFRHLAVLDVSRNFLTAAGRATIARLCKRVISDDQKVEEDGQRYASVGE